jgi:hypothetical protein
MRVLLMWTEDIGISSLMPLPLSISSCLSFPVLHTFVILRVWNQLADADPDKSQTRAKVVEFCAVQ